MEWLWCADGESVRLWQSPTSTGPQHSAMSGEAVLAATLMTALKFIGLPQPNTSNPWTLCDYPYVATVIAEKLAHTFWLRAVGNNLAALRSGC